MSIRGQNWSRIDNKSFDAVIIGAGINGASIYKKLCSMGYRVLILDKGDFSCGSSQASAMMIWGGLLYLKNLDLASVLTLSRDRDELIRSYKDKISPMRFRYVLNKEHGRSRRLVNFALHFYWFLGMCKRNKPEYQKHFDEESFINSESKIGSLTYQEGFLKQSDSRFVLDWIMNFQTEDSLALNYCDLEDCTFNTSERQWQLSLSDQLSGRSITTRARIIINCAGSWTDRVNEQFGLESPYRHVFSKGVFIAFERPASHQSPLIFEMGEHGDTLALVPFGPVSLWGPTETMVQSIDDGFQITESDINFLQRHANAHLKSTLASSRIVSLRCGIRPLAVKKDFKADCYPLDLSRHHKIIVDSNVPWISVYGGKISGCLSLADNVAARVSGKVSCKHNDAHLHVSRDKETRWSRFPGFDDKVPSLAWCVENEFCCTLDDYLRRRTNIAQWVARGGFGFHDENAKYLAMLAMHLPRDSRISTRDQLMTYRRKVEEGFDRFVKTVHPQLGGAHEAA